MYTIVSLYSEKEGEISKFLSKYYNTKFEEINNLKWEKKYNNPIEMSEIIGVFIDNKEKFEINMWISIDKNIFVNITKYNANDIIKYLYERFPY